MSHHQPGPSAVHFGAGALGRGLVVPRLAEAGWRVTLVDADRTLVEALVGARSYPLMIAGDGGSERRAVSIAGALRPDDPGLAPLLSRTPLVTTAVRRENLPRVARTLVAAWTEAGMPETVAVVGCENVERVDEVLAAAFAAAGISPAQRARLRLPRTVVDRICAADWPAGLGITTEPFCELAAAGGDAIPGIEAVSDIDARFARKRYLVNSFADASAVFGVTRGHHTLAEAIADPEVARQVAPLLAALRLHLGLAYGYGADSLAAYEEQSRRRLANAAIPRRLETVARDVSRKLAPNERFAEPLIDLEARGLLAEDAVAVLAAMVRAAGIGAASAASAPLPGPLSPAAARFYERLDAAVTRSV